MKHRYLRNQLIILKHTIGAAFNRLLNLFGAGRKCHYYWKIEGWFDFHNFYTEMLDRATDGSHFVEVGSYFGKSTSFMAVEIANRKKKIKFDAVDTFEGSPEHAEIMAKHGGSILNVFLHNMDMGGVRAYVNPIQMDSVSASKKYADQSLDFVFIDAAHDYDNVTADIKHWYPKVKVGGYIGGHDFVDVWPGVIQAVNEAFGKEYRVVDVSWMHHKANSNTYLRKD